MSTHALIEFGEMVVGRDRWNAESKIFIHWDGYPDNVLPELQQFFTADKEQNKAAGSIGSRLNDPSMLAARFVVWKAAQMAQGEHAHLNGKFLVRRSDKSKAAMARKYPLVFGGVRVVLDGDQGQEYTYRVDCSTQEWDTGFPKVTVTAS